MEAWAGLTLGVDPSFSLPASGVSSHPGCPPACGHIPPVAAPAFTRRLSSVRVYVQMPLLYGQQALSQGPPWSSMTSS